MKKRMTREQYEHAYKTGFGRTVDAVWRRRANREQACEIAQAAWARGWQHIHQLQDPRHVVGWVISIAINGLYDEVRRSKRMTELSTAGYEAKVSGNVNPSLIDLDRAMRLAPPPQRALLEAIYLPGTARAGSRRGSRGVAGRFISPALARAAGAAKCDERSLKSKQKSSTRDMAVTHQEEGQRAKYAKNRNRS